MNEGSDNQGSDNRGCTVSLVTDCSQYKCLIAKGFTARYESTRQSKQHPADILTKSPYDEALHEVCIGLYILYDSLEIIYTIIP